MNVHIYYFHTHTRETWKWLIKKMQMLEASRNASRVEDTIEYVMFTPPMSPTFFDDIETMPTERRLSDMLSVLNGRTSHMFQLRPHLNTMRWLQIHDHVFSDLIGKDGKWTTLKKPRNDDSTTSASMYSEYVTDGVAFGLLNLVGDTFLDDLLHPMTNMVTFGQRR